MDKGGLLLGLGVSVSFFFLRYALTAMPKSIAWAGVIGGILIVATGLMPSQARPILLATVLFLLGAMCLGGSVYFFLQHMAGMRTSKLTDVPPSSPSPRATFEATNRSEVLAKGAAISGTVPFPLARADTDSKVDMTGMLWISPDAPLKFPVPTGEFSRLSNAELRDEVRKLVKDLLALQVMFNADRGDMSADILSKEKLESHLARSRIIFEKYDREYTSKFTAPAISLASEMLSRTNGLEADSISPNANIGAHVIIQRKFAGSTPASSAAEFLESLAARLR